MLSLDRIKLTGRALFQEFFIRRFFRIYPLSIVCVLVSFFTPGAAWTVRQLIANLTLTQNLTYDQSMVGGLWTLPLELQMYLSLPFIYLWFRSKPVSWVLALWLLSLPFAIVQPMVSERLSVVAYVPCFLGGVIAWRMKNNQRFSGWLWPLAIAVAAFPWMTSEGNHMLPRWITCLSLGLAIPLFHDVPSRWVNIVSKTIAKYSYGIYLSHVAVMAIAFNLMNQQPYLMQVVTFLILAFTLPFLAFHLVERPMISLGKQIADKIVGVARGEE
jgi:peptidoglycan/LPS O-acetylase OafA/YrhL